MSADQHQQEYDAIFDRYSIDGILQRFDDLEDLVRRLIRRIFRDERGRLLGQEALFSNILNDYELSSYFPEVENRENHRIVRWYLEQLLLLTESPAFVPFSERLESSSSSHQGMKVGDRLVDQVTSRWIREIIHHHHKHMYKREGRFWPLASKSLALHQYLELWKVEELGEKNELPEVLRYNIFDSKVYGICRFLFPASQHYSLCMDDDHSTKELDTLKTQGAKALDNIIISPWLEEIKKPSNKTEAYDLLSSVTWAAATILQNLDLTDKDNNEIIEHACSVCTRVFKADGILRQLCEARPYLTKQESNDVKLLSSKYLRERAEKDEQDASGECEESLINQKFVQLHLLLNACWLLNCCQNKGLKDIACHEKDCSQNHQGIKMLTDLVYAYTVLPPLETDLYWLCLRFRVLNAFLRSHIFNSVASHMKESINTQLGVLEGQETYSEISNNQWVMHSERDKSFTKQRKRIRELIEDVLSEDNTRRWIGKRDRSKPVCILLASRPGDGKSHFVKNVTLEAHKKEPKRYIEINCSQFRTCEELLTTLDNCIFQKMMSHLENRNDKGKKDSEEKDYMPSLSIFLDEIDALEDEGIYQHLLPVVWDRELAGRTLGERGFEKWMTSNSESRMSRVSPTTYISMLKRLRIVFFFAASSFATCREYRLHLSSVPKGADFVSRLTAEIDLPGVAGIDQFAARMYIADVKLQERLGLLDSNDSERTGRWKNVENYRKMVKACGLNVSLNSSRAITKWIGQIPIEKEKKENPKIKFDRPEDDSGQRLIDDQPLLDAVESLGTESTTRRDSSKPASNPLDPMQKQEVDHPNPAG